MSRPLLASGICLVLAGCLTVAFVLRGEQGTNAPAVAAQAQIVEDLGWETPRSDHPGASRTPAQASEAPGYAETFAVLRVPRWGASYERPVSEGTEADVLNSRGVGHYVGTAMPGTEGNFAVAGHRTTYGKPFNRVEELEVGDALEVQTEVATYTYRVTGWRIVKPEDVWVLDDEPGRSTMTLTTCHPMYSNAERYVVFATLRS